MAERYGLGGHSGLVFVRPDGCIGLHACFGDGDAVVAYLARIRSGT